MKEKKIKEQAAKKQFEKDILRRGEAVKAGKPLRPGATHEIVEDERGKQTLRRRRFSVITPADNKFKRP
jgi:hypothetical protein